MLVVVSGGSVHVIIVCLRVQLSIVCVCRWLWVCVCSVHEFNVGQMSGGRVQESDSCGEEAVPVPGGLSPEAPVAPPRGQEGEESM